MATRTLRVVAVTSHPQSMQLLERHGLMPRARRSRFHGGARAAAGRRLCADPAGDDRDHVRRAAAVRARSPVRANGPSTRTGTGASTPIPAIAGCVRCCSNCSTSASWRRSTHGSRRPRLRVVAQAEGTRFRSDRNAQNDVRMPATIELAVAPAATATRHPPRRSRRSEHARRCAPSRRPCTAPCASTADSRSGCHTNRRCRRCPRPCGSGRRSATATHARSAPSRSAP